LQQRWGYPNVSRLTSNGISAWLFIGTNSSFGDTIINESSTNVTELFYALDLGDIPASFNGTPHWIVEEPVVPLSTSAAESITSGAHLASILLCDPNMKMSSAYVSFTIENNMLSITPKTLPFRVGNISPASAGLVLAQSLLGATSYDATYGDPGLSITSANIFLQNPLDEYAPLSVKSAANISSTIGSYVLSASKAWSDGYYTFGKFSTISLDATKDQPKLAL
jgi:hypothetical protein